MGNKKIKITLIIIISIIISFGILFILLPFFTPRINGTAFAGIMLILSGSILMTGLKSLDRFFSDVFNKLIVAFKNEDKKHLYFFLSILAVGAIFRILYLNKLVNYNEALIYLDFLNNKNFHQLFFYSSPDNFILNNIFIKLFFFISKELWVLRLPSLIAGISLIPLIYLSVRILYNKTAAMIAAAIISASPFFIYYSADMRGISLIMAIFLATLMIVRFLRYNDNLIAWLLLSAVSAAGFLLTPLFFLPFIAFMLWFVLSTLFKDTMYNFKIITSRIITVILVTFMLTFLFYMPVIVSSGIKNAINYNFIKTGSAVQALKSFMLLIGSSWFNINQVSNFIYLALLMIFILIGLIFSRKNGKHKVSVFYAAIIVALVFLLSGITFPFAEAWAFILPVLIMAASYGISCMFVLNRKITVERNSLKLSLPAMILSVLIIPAIFLPGFFMDSVSKINFSNTLQDYEKVVIDLRNSVSEKNKILLVQPSDYIINYGFNKKGIDLIDSEKNLYPAKNIIIIVNKAADQNLDDILKSIYPEKDLKILGFTKPEILLKYDSAIVYSSSNLGTDQNIIYDLNSENSIENLILKNFYFSEKSGTRELVMDEKVSDSLKIMQLPVKLEKNNDYLITFEIRNANMRNDTIAFDFFGENYDNPQQEFNIKTETLRDDDYLTVRKIINSGNIKNNNGTFFRIFSYSGAVFIKNLQIFKISK